MQPRGQTGPPRDYTLALLWNALAAARRGGIAGGWVNLAAGGTLTIAGSLLPTFVAVDGTGAANTLNLPSSANAQNGQIVAAAIAASAPGGAPVAPNLTITPGAGNQLWNPNNPGQILTTGTGVLITAQGAILWFKYRSAIVAPWTAPGWIELE